MPQAELYPANQILAAVGSAAIASMLVIRPYQLGQGIEQLADKQDGTVLTWVDHRSEKAARDVLRRVCPGVPISQEEGGMIDQNAYPGLFMTDSVDGTRPLLNGGPTSTAIAAFYNPVTKRFEATAIGEPARGLLWLANGQRATRTVIDMETGEAKSGPVVCNVWDGDYGDNSTVLIDNLAAFAREGGKRPILTNHNIVGLFTALQAKVAVSNFGSNGLHHALVANGGTRMAGAITTAMGGEWDVAGALTVLSARGVIEGWRMTDDRKLELSDNPLDPFSYDILLVANNGGTLTFLQGCLRKAVGLRT